MSTLLQQGADEGLETPVTRTVWLDILAASMAGHPGHHLVDYISGYLADEWL